MENKIVFMGSPKFAVPILKTLSKNYCMKAVFTQPDKRSGRGKNKKAPPVKIEAEKLGLDVYQPVNLRAPESFKILDELKPDMIIVAAFGQILKKNVLDLPKYGCINVHASLLPRWRGAAPIQMSILSGDKKTGISIMKMDEGIDTGPVYSQKDIIIKDDDNSQSLSERLSILGAQMLIDTLPKIFAATTVPQMQDQAGAKYAKMLQKSDGLLDLEKDIYQLERQVRAFSPWPGSFIIWRNNKLKIHKSDILITNNNETGKFRIINGLPSIGALNGWLLLEEVQMPGKKIVSGKAFLNGVRNWEK